MGPQMSLWTRLREEVREAQGEPSSSTPLRPLWAIRVTPARM